MATECTQETVLRFLTERGGRVRNTDLIEHFKPVMPTDPGRKSAAREAFKSYVDCIAVVKVVNGEKFVCLRKRYRTSPKHQEDGDSHHAGPVKLRDHVVTTILSEMGGKEEAEQEISPASGCNTSQGKLDGLTLTSPSTISQLEVIKNEDAKQESKPASGCGSDPCPSDLGGSTVSESEVCDNKDVKQEIQPASSARGVQIPLSNMQNALDGSDLNSPRIRTESGIGGKEMGNQHNKTKNDSVKRSDGMSKVSNLQSPPEAMGIPEIALAEVSSFPATSDAALGSPCLLPNNQAQSKGGFDRTCSDRSQNESKSKEHKEETGEGKGLDKASTRLTDEGRSVSASSTPKGSRKNFLEHMMSSSPQVRRSIVLKHSGRFKDAAMKHDSDSASVNSTNAEDESSPVTLEPMEHEWMMCACDGEWESLQRLLSREPNLITKKDFVTGFTCLHWAAKLGKHELIALLVSFARQKGVLLDINTRSSAGYTPLHLAAMHNHIEVIKILVGAFNADVEARDYSGKKANQYLRNDIGQDLRDIAGAEPTYDPGLTLQDETAQWKLPRVLQANLKLLNRSTSEDDAYDGVGLARERPLRRKSSLNKLKPRLSKRGAGPHIVHSTSLFERMEGTSAQGPGSSKSRPKSNLFG